MIYDTCHLAVWDFSSPLSCKMWLPLICQDIPYCVMPLAGRLQAILLWRQVWQAFVVNLLWPNDTLWRHKPGSTLSKLIDQCQMAPMHCLNQWWLLTIVSDQDTILYINYSFKNQTLHGDCRIYLKIIRLLFCALQFGVGQQYFRKCSCHKLQ